MATQDTSPHADQPSGFHPGEQARDLAGTAPDEAAVSSASLELAPGVSVHENAGVVAFAYSRSSGPGGQNVNKLSTKAEMRVRLERLPVAERVKRRLAGLAGRRLTDAGEIVITSESERSQSRNRSECIAKFRELLIQALAEPKIRRKTKPTRGSRERRLKEKKSRSDIKKNRRGSMD